MPMKMKVRIETKKIQHCIYLFHADDLQCTVMKFVCALKITAQKLIIT